MDSIIRKIERASDKNPRGTHIIVTGSGIKKEELKERLKDRSSLKVVSSFLKDNTKHIALVVFGNRTKAWDKRMFATENGIPVIMEEKLSPSPVKKETGQSDFSRGSKGRS